ncbi:ArsR/SmtB family transcription factor [Halorientalis marina]|jgi:DNA-binding transcriptional ArsR family regulator|uniref:ArsR/SmtB family transcription factor n=1 Tax=Halorientalis marina TaxID=2931976 RepID=UPI001FF3D6E1|nr:helix-turn-helix domain-containing protein [Halorientalis marina]
MDTTMPETVPQTRGRTDAELSQSGPDAAAGSNDSADSDELLSLLSDDSAREILTTISEDPLPAREIADQLDLSRPTVYRRLNRLEAIGVVETSLSFDADGHHRQQFTATLDRVVVSIDADRITVDSAA